MKFPAFEAIDLSNDSIDIVEIPLKHIMADSNQARKKFDEHTIAELAASIQQHGLIQPIIVKALQPDRYLIIAGERRWRAMQLAGFNKIPAIIQSHSNQENTIISLIENIQREELNPVELAQALQQLSLKHGFSHEKIGKLIGKNRATVTNLLRLLNLASELQQWVIDNKIEMGHARALLSLPADLQVEIAQEIILKSLSVRATERLIQRLTAAEQGEATGLDPVYQQRFQQWQTRWSEKLSTKINVQCHANGKGKIVLHFDSLEKADWLLSRFDFKLVNDD